MAYLEKLDRLRIKIFNYAFLPYASTVTGHKPAHFHSNYHRYNAKNACRKPYLVIILQVALGPSDNHLDPHAHELTAGRHQMKIPVERLDHKRGLAVRAPHSPHVIDEHLLDRLEVNAAAQLRLMSVIVVAQRALVAIEHKPALVPRLELLAHLEQVAATRVAIDVEQRLPAARTNVARRLVTC